MLLWDRIESLEGLRVAKNLDSDKAGRRLVLGVDDDHMIISFLSTVVRGENYAFTGAKSAEEAMPIIIRDRPDMIFLDMHMPGKDGVELCREIREKMTEYQAPIVFLTADHEEKAVKQAIAAGGNDYLVKPVSPNSVMERLKRWLPEGAQKKP